MTDQTPPRQPATPRDPVPAPVEEAPVETQENSPRRPPPVPEGRDRAGT